MLPRKTKPITEPTCKKSSIYLKIPGCEGENRFGYNLAAAGGFGGKIGGYGPFSIANHRFGFSISKYLGIDTSHVKV